MAWRRIDVHRAAERGDLAVLTRYLDAGGDPEKKDAEYGAAPAHWASLRGRVDALSFLLDRGARLESRTGTDGTPLVWGCMGGNAGVVRHLLERGADIAAITRGKGTALHHATHSGHPGVVSILLEKGADPKAQDNRGERPGDKFDPEVSDSVRRVIVRALAKAMGQSVSERRSSRSKRRDNSRSASVSRGKSRSVVRDHNGITRSLEHTRGRYSKGQEAGYSTNGSSHRSRGRREEIEREMEGASAVAAAALTHGSEHTSDPPARVPPDDDSMEAAAAAAAAASWAPTPPEKKADSGDSSGSSSATANGTVGARIARTTSATSNRSSNGDDLAAKAINMVLDSSKSLVSGEVDVARSARSNGYHSSRSNGNHHQQNGTDRAASETVASRRTSSPTALSSNTERAFFPTSRKGTQQPLPAQPVVATSLTAGDDPEIDEIRRQVRDTSLAAGKASDRGGEKRSLLRQAVVDAEEGAEEALTAERARSDRLQVLVQALEQRLRGRDDQVIFLNEQLDERESRLNIREDEVTSLRKRVEELKEGMSDLRNHIKNIPPEASSSSPPPPSPLPAEAESPPRAYPRTRSSPTLSPHSNASRLREMWLATGVDQNGSNSGVGHGKFLGDKESSKAGSRRNTIGGSSAGGVVDKGFGFSGTGNSGSQDAVVEWWRRGDWPDDSSKRKKPAPVIENQESLGSLYSMIARR